MFEIEDAKLGPAKVVSITEARQSMATIMTDREFSYIITKNSEPVRVIVNYETLKRFQVIDDAKQLASGQISDKTTFYLDESVSSKTTKSQGSLRGILREREEELKKQEETKTTAPQSKKKAVNDPLSEFESKNLALEQRIAKFSKPTVSLVEESAAINQQPESAPHVEFAVDESNQEAHSILSDENTTGDLIDQPNEFDYVDENQEESAYEGNEGLKEQAAYQGDKPGTSLIQETIESGLEETETGEENNDYFKRFEKLYTKKENESTFNTFAKPDELTPAALSNYSAEMHSDGLDQDVDDGEEELIKDESTSGRRRATELPSIDDLLRELEQTKLTDEE